MSTKQQPVTILIVDDDPDDREMTQEAFGQIPFQHDLRMFENGEKMLQYLRREGSYSDPALSPRPSLILLDLNMPVMDGKATLRAIKSDPDIRQIPVVVMTTSKTEEDIFASYDHGANSFITKPVRYSTLVEVVRDLKRYWTEIVVLPDQDR